MSREVAKKLVGLVLLGGNWWSLREKDDNVESNTKLRAAKPIIVVFALW